MPPTTPPPPSPSSLRTPPTPLHGPKFDNYEPWAPRMSTRSSVQKTQYRARTPPRQDANELESNLSTPLAGKRTTRTRRSPNNLSPPSSAHPSPQKGTGKAPKASGQRNVSGTLDDNSTTIAAVAPGTSVDDSGPSFGKEAGPASVFGHGMLPTPAKTPKKRHTQPVAGLGSAARVLFAPRPPTVEEAMPSPRKSKKGKKHNELSLHSFSDDQNDDGDEEKIEIYTDSKERIPEMDISDDNPFISRPGQAAAAEEARSLRRRRKVRTDVSHDVEESLKRDDGMYYVFRGKKVFRKFDEPNPNDNDNTGSPPPRTRSSIKPRLLFPTKEQVQAREKRDNGNGVVEDQHMTLENEVDEEAVTDIDESRITKSQEILETEDSEMTDVVDADTEPEAETDLGTPERDPKIDPFSSPPASGTRSGRGSLRRVKSSPHIDGGGSPLGSQNAHMTRSKESSFSGWKRTKAGLSSGRVRKREGGEVVGESVSKRTRAAGGI
ncbi:hypothetical protein FGG08_002948 [Glutinoglossum americanum]|uniref:Uncharacterized protein n=1 Tax=Glutinoglossum americanum TaxID=1670608 RepID=A0A9P8I8A7_9PEZI|nr:hypothetical protein FGG08_002948 [Glutinoglossum americanum]